MSSRVLWYSIALWLIIGNIIFAIVSACQGQKLLGYDFMSYTKANFIAFGAMQVWYIGLGVISYQTTKRRNK